MGRRKRIYFITLTVGLLSLTCLFNISALYAQSLSFEDAKSWAKSWHNSDGKDLKTNIESLSLELKGLEGEENIYLADFASSGFVIFSNDKNPVLLGYSFDDPLPSDPRHPLYTDWIPAYSAQLLAAEKQKSTLNNTNGPPDEPGMDEFVEPLIQAKWGQGIPWNKFCPADSEGNHAPVGCVAVALAQIMKTWNWPQKGSGQNSYIPSSHREYGKVEALFDTTYYEWDKMNDKTPADASALILFHAGVATNMNYAPNESGANSSVYAATALIDHFLYNPDMVFREKGSFSYDMWAQLLRQDIVNGRPVLYRGTDPHGGLGHAFNIDGFRDEYFFHFNWGWNGWGNGYYRLEAMAAGGGNFTNGQAALFGIQPEYQPQHDRPFGLQVMAGDGFAQLFWDEPIVSNLSHYNIYRNGELIESTWETRFRDDNLLNRTNYTYTITAEYVGDIPGESPHTPAMEITPWEILPVPYEQNFNDTLAGWQIGGTNKSFQWMIADSLGFPGNGTRILGIRSDSAGAGNKVSDYLISPMLDLRGVEGAAYKFDYVFQQVPQVDYLFLMYRRFDNGLWYPIARLDSTESWSDWKTFYGYFPQEAKNTLIQLGFFYTDFNGVGKGAAIDNVEIFNITDAPVPDFTLSHTENCQYQFLTVSDQSKGPVTDWFWDFGEDAEPRFSNEPGPHNIFYKEGGLKSIKLILNHLDLKVKENIVEILWEPKADFSYERDVMQVKFHNLSKNYASVLWNFGDGRTSAAINPVYQYRNKFLFNVEMICFNPPCVPDTMRMEVDLRNGTGVEDISFEESVKVFPNPAGNYINLLWANYDQSKVSIELISPTGAVLHANKEEYSESTHIDLPDFSPGIYWLKITRNDKQVFRKLIIL